MSSVIKKVEKFDQPPKNKIENKKDITSIWLYSARKKNAKGKDEYSILYPETNSDSASGKSNGVLLVSANAVTKKTYATGIKNKNQKFSCWKRTILVKLKLEVYRTIGNKDKVIGNS